MNEHPRDPTLYRANVGLALFNPAGKVFYGRRVEKRASAAPHFIWQMPQGGVDKGESPSAAALRELNEEVGVSPDLVEIVEETEDWIYYDFPMEIRSHIGKRSKFRGQRQKWFALRFLGKDSDIRLDLHTPEFDHWRWGDLAEAPRLIIPFKRAAYEEVVRRFSRYAR
ncbi:MAG TPA: RNA pyrophosphohydrolase [Caulobacterales bacterium]|nr:RNA pyrophosphohydrolase [Caulobacterales bacterium]